MLLDRRAFRRPDRYWFFISGSLASSFDRVYRDYPRCRAQGKLCTFAEQLPSAYFGAKATVETSTFKL